MLNIITLILITTFVKKIQYFNVTTKLIYYENFCYKAIYKIYMELVLMFATHYLNTKDSSSFCQLWT